MWQAYIDGNEDGPEDTGPLHEYGLAFDYVPGDTYPDNEDGGYFLYQISWGGPSEEFRFFADPELKCYRIEFWFLDWFDGASRTLRDGDKALMMDFFNDLKENGTLEYAIREATDNN